MLGMERREIPERIRNVLPQTRQTQDVLRSQNFVVLGEFKGHPIRHDDLSHMRQPNLCQSEPPLHGKWQGQQYGHGEAQSWEPASWRAVLLGEAYRDGREVHPVKRSQASAVSQDVLSRPVYDFTNQKREKVETPVSGISLTLKRRELRESPNGGAEGNPQRSLERGTFNDYPYGEYA